MKKMNKQYLWKSMNSGLKSGCPDRVWKIGKWYNIKGDLSICKDGFNASKRIVDTMQHVGMENLAKVEVRGNCLIKPDSQCWSEMRIVKAWKWTKEDSIALSIYAVSLSFENFGNQYPSDKSPRQAVQEARRWLKNPTDPNSWATWCISEFTDRYPWSSAEFAISRVIKSANWYARPKAESEKIFNMVEKWIRRRISKLEVIGELNEI